MTIDLIQGSDEWVQARVGKFTASRTADALSPLKGGKGWRAERKHYCSELVCERLSNKPYPQHVTQDMLRGNEMEPRARDTYALFYAPAPVVQVGLVPHPTIPMFAASPDGLVGKPGIVEFKCPKIGTHMETCETDEVNEDYIKQIHAQFACLPERKWADFVSFHPDAPEEMQVKVIRIERDDELVAYIEREVPIFLREVQERVSVLSRKYNIGATAAVAA